MNAKYWMLFAFGIGCFFSCGKNNAPTPQSLITGTWSLQQEHVLINQDSSKLIDTTLSASASTYATAVFNSDGTFSSSSVYFPGNNSLSTSPPPSAGKSSGKYSYSNNVFTISPGLSGWYTFVLGSTGPPTNISQSIEITQLTMANLSVHSENKFTLNTSTGIHSYDEVFDYYYKK